MGWFTSAKTAATSATTQARAAGARRAARIAEKSGTFNAAVLAMQLDPETKTNTRTLLKAVFRFIERGCNGQYSGRGCKVTVSGRGRIAVATRNSDMATAFVQFLDALRGINDCLSATGFDSWTTGNTRSDDHIVYITPMGEDE